MVFYCVSEGAFGSSDVEYVALFAFDAVYDVVVSTCDVLGKYICDVGLWIGDGGCL